MKQEDYMNETLREDHVLAGSDPGELRVHAEVA